jgi:hypothetical protein
MTITVDVECQVAHGTDLEATAGPVVAPAEAVHSSVAGSLLLVVLRILLMVRSLLRVRVQR